MSLLKNPDRAIPLLTLIALAAMIAAYFAPIWWVSLTAPNYPKDAFPDGIRIHFHFDGVYNGCKATLPTSPATASCSKRKRCVSPSARAATTGKPA